MGVKTSRGLSLRKETVRRLVGGAAAVGALLVTMSPGQAIAADNAGPVVMQPGPQPGPVELTTHGCDVCQTTHYP